MFDGLISNNKKNAPLLLERPAKKYFFSISLMNMEILIFMCGGLISDNEENTNAQVSLTHWDGFKFSILDTYDEDDLSAQYLNGWQNRTQVTGNTNSYPSSDDWSVERITIQDGVGITYSNTLIEVDFKIKDKINLCKCRKRVHSKTDQFFRS